MQDRSPEDMSADFDAQGASARPGGAAKGGIDPQPGDAGKPGGGDPSARRKMRELGFGDDKGGDIS